MAATEHVTPDGKKKKKVAHFVWENVPRTGHPIVKGVPRKKNLTTLLMHACPGPQKGRRVCVGEWETTVCDGCGRIRSSHLLRRRPLPTFHT